MGLSLWLKDIYRVVPEVPSALQCLCERPPSEPQNTDEGSSRPLSLVPTGSLELSENDHRVLGHIFFSFLGLTDSAGKSCGCSNLLPVHEDDVVNLHYHITFYYNSISKYFGMSPNTTFIDAPIAVYCFNSLYLAS